MDNNENQRLLKKTLETVFSSIRFPTGKQLRISFVVSFVLLIFVIVMSCINLFTFISWQGATISTLYLGILLILEGVRKDGNKYAISGLSENIKSCFDKIRLRRAASDSISTNGAAGSVHDESICEDGARIQSESDVEGED